MTLLRDLARARAVFQARTLHTILTEGQDMTETRYTNAATGQEWVRADAVQAAERSAWDAAIDAAAQRMREFMVNDTALPESLIRDISESVRALKKGQTDDR